MVNTITIVVIAIFLSSIFLLSQSFSLVGQKRKQKRPYIKSISYECAKTSNKTVDKHLDLVPGIQYKLYIISHNSHSLDIAKNWSTCMPFVEHILIESSPFFESWAYATILNQPQIQKSWDNLDFIGIATYKSLKFVSIEKMKAYLELAKLKPYDVVPLLTTGEELIPQALKGHGQEFEHVWNKLLGSLNFSKEDMKRFENIEVFLRNTYIVNPIWLKKLAKFIENATREVIMNEELSTLFKQNAHYREMKMDVAQSVFHAGYYQWHPFIFERLPSFFFTYYNASVFQTIYQTTWFDTPTIGDLYKGL